MRDGTPDLLVSDLRMPNMSGFELFSIVRQRFPAIAVIAYSGEFATAGKAKPQAVAAT
jgi:YesN/AraC family two-component response regulator